MEIKRSIARGWGKGELYDILVALKNGQLPIGGETFYVSQYGNNTTGLSWETAFTTIASAIAAAVAENAARPYVRNRIYIEGGANYAETLVAFPTNCDIVGVGTVSQGQVMVYGTTNIATAVKNCHVYNLRFYNITNSVPVVTICSSCHGIEFHNCVFVNGDGNNSTIGLKMGSCRRFKVHNCRFAGNPPSVIGITVDGIYALDAEIKDCIISATTTGISVANGTTADYGFLIKGNVIARMDPNTVAQMTTGIAYLDTQSRIHSFICDNFISAVTYISHAGGSSDTALANATVGNRYVAAGDHYIDGHAIS